MLIKRKLCFHLTVFKYLLTFICVINISTVNAQTEDDYMWDCDNGQLIDSEDLCDGKIHCADGSDEIAENCIHLNCPTYSFRCAYGACVSKTAACNGNKDCVDNSDELEVLCTKDQTKLDLKMQGTCSDGFMQCSPGECIEVEDKCDGRLHCENGLDESLEVCSKFHCPSYAFSCGYGGCVRGNSKCDGKKDCPDGSDEAWKLCSYPRTRNVTKVETTSSTTTTTTSTTTTRRPPSIINTVFEECTFPVDATSVIATNRNLNKIVQPGEKVKKDTLVEFSCDPGVTLEGETRLICASGGKWNHDIPTCSKYCSGKEITSGFSTVVTCSYMGGHVKCNDRLRPGTKAQVECADSFIRPTGSQGVSFSTLECTNSGKWNHPRTPCRLQCGIIAPQTTEFAKGGDNVNITKVPWHVGIYSIFDVTSYKHICGGSIISPRLVVSAAHCFWDKANSKLYDESYFTLVAGKYFSDYYSKKEYFQPQHRNISKIIVESYKDKNDNYLNDIALLILSSPLKFTHSIRPVCSEFYDRALKNVKTNEKGKFAGWGISDDNLPSETLQAVEMTTLSFDDCEKRLNEMDLSYQLKEDKFCITNPYGGTACRGDSGGGFVIEDRDYRGRRFFRLGGVVSHAPVTVQDCGKDGLVAMTNIQYFDNLIKDHFEKESEEEY